MDNTSAICHINHLAAAADFGPTSLCEPQGNAPSGSEEQSGKFSLMAETSLRGMPTKSRGYGEIWSRYGKAEVDVFRLRILEPLPPLVLPDGEEKPTGPGRYQHPLP